MRKLMIALGSVALIAGCGTQDKNTTTSTSQASASAIPKASQNQFNFPKATCGDKPTGDNDTWHPVFVDGGNLETLRSNFCADATSTIRKDSKVESVQLASFTSRERAIEFAKAVGGDVGEPTYPDVATSSPNPQVESVDTNWSDELCQDQRYFMSNGASTAQYNSCQYINSDSLKQETIILATAKDSENVADSMVERGFRKVSWQDDFNPLIDQSSSVCIVYNDKSVACHKGEGSNLSSTSLASSEAILTANDPDSRINLRESPSTAGKDLGYGVVGDRVEIIKQTTSDGYNWHKVKFPRSGAVGWIRGDFVNVVSASQTSQPSSESYSSSSSPDYATSESYTSTASTSGGSCNSPDDLDSRGYRCGGRATSVRPSRRGGRR